MEETTTTRLNKAMSLLGICSRRSADALISSGRVSVNGKPIIDLGTKISNFDTISFGGKNYTLGGSKKEERVWIYYKPVGLITSHNDERDRETVFQQIKRSIHERVISVGRLDINSEGLLLVTNSNDFARYAESPKTGWKRVYRVRIFGYLTKDVIDKIESGVTIDGFRYMPMKINTPENTMLSKNMWCECIITEGKNREIRKIFNHFGIMVSRLIRYRYGPYELGDLKPGEVKKAETLYI